MQVLPHNDHHHTQVWMCASQAFTYGQYTFQVAYHSLEMGPQTDALVCLSSGTIDGDMEAVQPATDAPFSPSIIKQSQVRVRGDTNTLFDCILDHIEEAWMHHRFAQPL